MTAKHTEDAKGPDTRLFHAPKLFGIPSDGFREGGGRVHEWGDPEVYRFDGVAGFGYRTVEFGRAAQGKQIRREEEDNPVHRWEAVCGLVRFLVALGPFFAWLVHGGILRLSATSSKDANAAL